MIDFLDIFEHSREELQDILELAESMKEDYLNGGNPHYLKAKFCE